MGADFYIKSGDTRPVLEKQLLDSAGAGVDLSGPAVAVVFIMSQNDGTPKVNRAGCSFVDAVTGRVRYTWAAGDTDTPGQYDGEFEVNFGAGAIQTFPNPKRMKILVVDDLG